MSKCQILADSMSMICRHSAIWRQFYIQYIFCRSIIWLIYMFIVISYIFWQ